MRLYKTSDENIGKRYAPVYRLKKYSGGGKAWKLLSWLV